MVTTIVVSNNGYNFENLRKEEKQSKPGWKLEEAAVKAWKSNLKRRNQLFGVFSESQA